MSIEQFDAVIIGAGMSGLAAGIRLAQFDYKVCILEKHSVWGGLNSFYKKGGRQFDVGLHAMTNFARKGDKKGPLPTIARQLRLSLDQFQLLEQKKSKIHFPSEKLNFSNDLQMLEDEIAYKFPHEIDGFKKLCQAVREHNDGSLEQKQLFSRQVMGQWLKSPLLIDMILCPLLFYGSAREHDMDWNQFVIMFKSIFFEGFSRPHNGVRVILSLLRKTYLQRGGELKMSHGVAKLENLSSGGVLIHLENGNTLQAKRILSSAGAVETLKLLGKTSANQPAGAMTFVETIFCLDREPKELDINSSIIFFSQKDTLDYCNPKDLVDFNSGILCSPNNFQDDKPLSEKMLRLTNIANYDLWQEKYDEGKPNYNLAKNQYIENQIKCLTGIIPPFKEHVKFTDSFTPITIKHFTSHVRGAVYGSANKNLTGEIGEKNVFLCGTDQGYLGIVGSMLSGIIMANRHVLKN